MMTPWPGFWLGAGGPALGFVGVANQWGDLWFSRALIWYDHCARQHKLPIPTVNFESMEVTCGFKAKEKLQLPQHPGRAY
eukprot:12428547-Karenia_brevis.AAC.1